MRVLVTGASGFIGGHVVAPLLACGAEVHAVSRSDAVPEGTHGHVVDLMDSSAVAAVLRAVRPTHLLHLAWCTTPGRYWTAAENFDWVAASLWLYRRFADLGGMRAVVAGTCAEYDWTGPVLDEASTPCRPASLYGYAKHQVHCLLEQAEAAGGPPVAWGRVFFLYGPGERPGRLISDVVLALLRGVPVETTAGTQRRDFLHVADVAGAFAALCDDSVRGAVNIGSGEPRPLRDLVTRLADLVGRPDLLRLGSRLDRPGEPAQLTATVSRLRKEIGFAPRFDIDAGLADTVAWWRSRLTGAKVAG